MIVMTELVVRSVSVVPFGVLVKVELADGRFDFLKIQMEVVDVKFAELLKNKELLSFKIAFNVTTSYLIFGDCSEHVYRDASCDLNC